MSDELKSARSRRVGATALFALAFACGACGGSSSVKRATVSNALPDAVIVKAVYRGTTFATVGSGESSANETVSSGEDYAFALVSFPGTPGAPIVVRTSGTILADSATNVAFTPDGTVGPCNGLSENEYDSIGSAVFPGDAATPFDRVDCAADATPGLSMDPSGNAGDAGPAWLSGDPGPAWMGGRGTLISGDDGEHFVRRGPPTDATLRSLFCVEGTHVWGAGDSGTMVFTPDTGQSWQVQAPSTTVTLRGVAFANRYEGNAVGDDGTALRTVDSGAHWTAVTLNTPSRRAVARGGAAVTLIAPSVRAVARVGSVVLAVGDLGLVARSTDGGVSYAAEVASAGALNAVRFAADRRRVVAAGEAGRVLFSDDVGASWRVLRDGGAELRGVAVLQDGATIVAIGTGGTILRSTDRGASWTNVTSPAAVDLNAIAFSTSVPSVGWVAGASGTILRTDDAGASFRQLPSPTTSDLLTVVQMAW